LSPVGASSLHGLGTRYPQWHTTARSKEKLDPSLRKDQWRVPRGTEKTGFDAKLLDKCNRGGRSNQSRSGRKNCPIGCHERIGAVDCRASETVPGASVFRELGDEGRTLRCALLVDFVLHTLLGCIVDYTENRVDREMVSEMRCKSS
jgi:hypothetical protein